MKSRLLTFIIKWRRLYAVIGKTFGFLANERHPRPETTGGVAVGTAGGGRTGTMYKEWSARVGEGMRETMTREEGNKCY
jgi:hypothetical protein